MVENHFCRCTKTLEQSLLTLAGALFRDFFKSLKIFFKYITVSVLFSSQVTLYKNILKNIKI